MTRMVVHQLAHGYKRGHQLLASSLQLETKSADLILRLSDLSGSASSEAEIRPYITAYPLPCGKFYALAKTWLDEHAPRAGCVLTHTLLIQMNHWAELSEPQDIAELFVRPQNADDIDAYQAALTFDNSQSTKKTLYPPRQETAIEFVAKYFGEGLRPLVWFGEPKPEDIFWYVTRSLWPSLRTGFACCTFSLQPRTLEDRPFDLLLAPLSVQSRFLKLPRENILSGTSLRGNTASSSRVEEPWHQTFANTIFKGDVHNSVPTREDSEFSSLLTKDPTAIRNLFLIKRLQKRIDESPTASIGLMDAVAALAPEDNQAVIYKKNLVATALSAAKNIPSAGEALKCYFLIGERLGRLPFKRSAAEVESQLYKAVAHRTTQDAEAALDIGEKLLTPHTSTIESAYAKGVIAGLMKLAVDNPAQLSVLHRFPVAAATIITTEPDIAQGFLLGMKEQGELSIAEADLMAWLTTATDPKVYSRLQSALLPQIEGDSEAALAEELLTHVDRTSLTTILNTLCRTTDNFTSPRIRQIVGERISEVFPVEVRSWGRSTNAWSEGVAEVIAAAYPANATGFIELLEDSFANPERKAEVIAVFLDTISIRGLPLWLKEHVKRDASFLIPVLALGRETSQKVSDVVSRILEEVRDLPLAMSPDIIDIITNVRHLSFSDILIDRALRSAIVGFIKGEIDRESFQVWQAQDWSIRWFERVNSWDLESLVVGKSYDNLQAWEKAWAWTSEAPDVLYYRDPPIIPVLVAKLIGARRGNWKWHSNLSETWVAILHRTANAKQNLAYLYLCSHALDYAFSHKQYPLGGVVAEAFPKVYTTLLKSPTVSPMTSIIFSIISWIDSDWDKGKDLRQRLVSEFMDSTWAPGDLALAARDTELLRKVFKRIMRRPDGERYVAAMLRDLKGRNGPLAARTSDTLAKLVKNPNFDEPWE